ncbi:RcnB family protein [Gluconacetobacter aggeris]|uniref:RcnB family protein n=1 Tax=Gluconacetobacter aggeris TaxID=1286186 RepID=UPI003083FD41
MKTRLIAALVMSCAIVGASGAYADPYGPGYDRGGPNGQGDNRGHGGGPGYDRGGPNGQGDNRGHGGGPGYDRGGPNNQGDNRGYGGGPGYDRGRPANYGDNRGRGPGGPGYDRGGPWNGGGRVWRRGDRYDGPRSGMWAVQDWRRYRGLYAPPPGYYWVQYGNQFLLTAVATGIIASVIAGAYGAGPMGPGPY